MSVPRLSSERSFFTLFAATFSRITTGTPGGLALAALGIFSGRQSLKCKPDFLAAAKDRFIFPGSFRGDGLFLLDKRQKAGPFDPAFSEHSAAKPGPTAQTSPV